MSITKISPDVVDFDAGITISTTDNSNNLTLTSTDADSNAGPILDFYRNSASPAVGDLLGRINFRGRNDNSQDVDYAAWHGRIFDETDGTEDGSLRADIMYNGTVYDVFTLYGNEVVVNESSNDIDFRVESDDNAHMLFVDAGNNRVGIGRSDPSVALTVDPAANVTTSLGSPLVQVGGGNSWAGDGSIYTIGFGYIDSSIPSKSPAELGFFTETNVGYTKGSLIFATRGATTDVAPTERMRIDSNGNVGVGRNPGVGGTTDYGHDLYGSGHYYQYVDASGNSDAYRLYNSSGTNTAAIQADGDYMDLSDERYKENIVDAPSVLDTISKMKVRSFNWKEDGRKKTYGFIAQELNQVASEAVSLPEDDEDVWGVKHARIVPMLTKAIQEQQTLIETLQAEVKALKEA